LHPGDAGTDTGGSRAWGQAEYVVRPDSDGGAQVVLTTRALLVGPLAKFSRGTVVNDIVYRVPDSFVKNLQARMAGLTDSGAVAPLNAGRLFRQVIKSGIQGIFTALLARPGKNVLNAV